jgi:hypothetical protein
MAMIAIILDAIAHDCGRLEISLGLLSQLFPFVAAKPRRYET